MTQSNRKHELRQSDVEREGEGGEERERREDRPLRGGAEAETGAHREEEGYRARTVFEDELDVVIVNLYWVGHDIGGAYDPKVVE